MSSLLHLEGPRPELPPLRLLMRCGSCWPCWGTSAKDSRVTKNSRALIWPLLTLLTCGHPSHSGAMQKEELDLGTFHKQEETWGDHKEGDKASKKDHRNGVGTEIRRAVQQVCCTNKCLSHDDPWTPILDQPTQRTEYAKCCHRGPHRSS